MITINPNEAQKEQFLKDLKTFRNREPVLTENDFDPVNRPSHYANSKIEVIDYIEDKQLGFCLGNAIKYISRAGKKKDSGRDLVEKEIEDLQKAIWYINRRIYELENNKRKDNK